MGLRSLYTIVAKLVSDLLYLKPSVACILGFVGFKMTAEYFHYTISVGVSLSIVLFILGSGILLSILVPLISRNKLDQNLKHQ